MDSDDCITAADVRSTINSSHRMSKSVKHCSYQVWLNMFRASDREEVDENWRKGLSHFCVDHFATLFLRDHGKRLP